MTYITPTMQRSTSGILANRATTRTPFVSPTLPPQAKTAFQQPLGYTQSQINQSLASNPNASNGAYGVTGNGINGTPIAGTPTMPSQTGSSSSLYDPTTDPIYQKIQALGTQQVSQAVAGGDALRKQILVGLGDPTFAAQQQFGDPNAPTYGDTSTEQAAAQNPYSTMAQLATQHVNNNASIDQSANKAGLYYSSTHANQLGDENQAYGQNVNTAEGGASTQLSNIVQQILAAQNTAQSANIGGLDTATQNAINTAIQNGYTITYDPSTGEPVFTKTPTTPTTTTGATTPTTPPGGQTPNTTAYNPITRSIIAMTPQRQNFLNYGLRNSL